MTSTLLRAPVPLTVPAFGRVWHLTPWYEPVWWSDGRLAALEMLSRLKDMDSGEPASPEVFFSQLPLSEQFRILRWQLDVLVLMTPWCRAREVPVSLNITRRLAMMCLSDAGVQETLLMLAPRVRLEISEHFLPAGVQPRQDALLPHLQQLAPLWLDDFGAGSTSLSWLMSGLFEALKIDRHLLGTLKTHPGGEGFLSGLCGLARDVRVQVIAEGVEDIAHLDFSLRSRVAACQGWLWPGISPEQLSQLPDRLPYVNQKSKPG